MKYMNIISIIICVLVTTTCMRGIKKYPNHKSKKDIDTSISGFSMKLQDQHGYLSIPVTINTKKVSLQLTNAQIPSWIFLEKGQLCVSDTCKNVTSEINCKQCPKTKIEKDTSFNQQKNSIEGKQTININYSIVGDDKKESNMKEQFIVASKVVEKINPNYNFSGMINVKGWQHFQLKEVDNVIYGSIGKTQQQQKKSLNLDAQEGKIVLYAINKQILNLQSQQVEFLVSSLEEKFIIFPQEISSKLKQLLLKTYFEGKCKIASNKQSIICKKLVNEKQYVFDICPTKQICFKINAKQLIKKVNSKNYSFQFGTHQSTKITLNLLFLKFYNVVLEKGNILKVQKNQKYKLYNVSQNVKEVSSPVVQANKPQSGESSYSLLYMFIIYLLIGILIIIVVKLKATQSFVARSIDYMFQSLSGIFHRQKGYEASKMNEEIDDSNTLSVGYNKNSGGQMFWQKNSVQGI